MRVMSEKFLQFYVVATFVIIIVLLILCIHLKRQVDLIYDQARDANASATYATEKLNDMEGTLKDIAGNAYEAANE